MCNKFISTFHLLIFPSTHQFDDARGTTNAQDLQKIQRRESLCLESQFRLNKIKDKRIHAQRQKKTQFDFDVYCLFQFETNSKNNRN